MAALSRLKSAAGALRHPLAARSYRVAAAAQPLLDYDLIYNHDRDLGGERKSPSPELDTEASSTSRGVQWVFIGSPNSKKRVYAELISRLLDVPHISISSLLRQDLNPRSPLYKQIAEALNRGKLVPESIIFGLLSKRLEDGHYRGETGFILDGIPRTRLQAEVLDQLVNIDLVVNFKCSEDSFQAGVSTPDASWSCHRPYSGFPGPDRAHEDVEPKVSAFYREQMKSLEDYYQNQKKLIDFQVKNAPGETWKGLIAALHLQHVNAVHSSRMLALGFRVP